MRVLWHRRPPRARVRAIRDARVTAFLDIRPVTPGHLLVVPNEHLVYLADVPEPLGAHLFVVGQRLAAALRASGLPCDGINLYLADGEAAGRGRCSTSTSTCSGGSLATGSGSTRRRSPARCLSGPSSMGTPARSGGVGLGRALTLGRPAAHATDRGVVRAVQRPIRVARGRIRAT